MARIDEILATERPRFARAVKAVVAGDATALRAELSAEPELVCARSSSAHRATLLHYTAANGIESELQREVPNADEIARMLWSPARNLTHRAMLTTANVLRLWTCSRHPIIPMRPGWPAG
jgi:hypothetical protein